MAEKEIQFRKKRELGDIISDSFEFIKQERRPLLKLLFVYVVPFVVLYAIVQVLVQIKIMGSVDLTNPEDVLSKLGPIYFNLFLSMLFGLFVQSLLGGAFYSYIEIYVRKGKNNFDLNEITPLLFSNSLLALSANFVLFIIIMAGIVMCILPGLYFANTFSLVLMMVIFEKKGLGNALSRSWALVNSQWWNTFLINILGVLIIMAFGFVLSIPSMIAGVSTSFFSLKETGTLNYPDWYWVLMGISTVITSILYVIPYTFLAFQYFNLDEWTSPVQQPPVQNSLNS